MATELRNLGRWPFTEMSWITDDYYASIQEERMGKDAAAWQLTRCLRGAPFANKPPPVFTMIMGVRSQT